jgi:hypothetical protein
VNTFGTWLFAGLGVAVGTALPAWVGSAWSRLGQAVTSLVQRLQPTERYNSLGLASWAVQVAVIRDKPDDPVVLKVEGNRATSLEGSVRRTGMVAEPLTEDQRLALMAATRDYGPGGAGYWRRHPPGWTRRELRLARLFVLSRGTERCMVYGGTITGTSWVAVCCAPRWHRGAHRWQRFSVGTLTAPDPGPRSP